MKILHSIKKKKKNDRTNERNFVMVSTTFWVLTNFGKKNDNLNKIIHHMNSHIDILCCCNTGKNFDESICFRGLSPEVQNLKHLSFAGNDQTHDHTIV